VSVETARIVREMEKARAKVGPRVSDYRERTEEMQE
jgi:hypothetical protein